MMNSNSNSNSNSLSYIFLFQAFVFAIALLLCQRGVVQSEAQMVETTCKQTPSYNLCISTLKSSPKYKTVRNVPDIGLIMVDAVKHKTISTLNLIKQLIRKNPKLKQPLIACADRYDAILTMDVPEAVQALSFGDYKFAEQGANDAALEANSCEAKFDHGKSPLTKYNKDVHDLSLVTSAIARQLL